MFTITAITDLGLVRDNNEDFYLYSTEKRIIIVADGIGGYAHGEVASKLAAESCYALLESELDVELSGFSSPEEVLTAGIKFANKAILDAKVEHTRYKQMGTTLTCVYIDHDYLYYSYVGDSRVYYIDAEARTMHLLTSDHTLSQKLISQELAPKMHRQANNILTRVVGAKFSVNPEFGRRPIKKGDFILACTDGLSDLLTEQAMLASVLNNKQNPDRCLAQLISQTKEQGARDNITVVLACYDC